MDWCPERPLARASYLIRAEAEGELQFANAGWPGSIGVVSGMSARGFAVVLNAVIAPGGMDKLGYPVLLHLRRVLEDAAGFDEAVRLLRGQRLTSGCLLTVVGTENDERIVIERTPRRHALRRPDGAEPLVTTNHYRSLETPSSGDPFDPGERSCSRYRALQSYFVADSALDELDDARLLYALTDREVIQQITAQHVIIRPRARSIRLLVPRRLMCDEANIDSAARENPPEHDTAE